MRKISIIVEGDGDVLATPTLIAKSAAAFDMQIYVCANPIRAGEVRKLRRSGELERYLELAASHDEADSIFVLLDLDDDCAKEMSQEFRERAAPIAAICGKPIHICFVVKEFECWFLASIDKISRECGDYGISADELIPSDPERIRGAKEKLSSLCKKRKYKEIRDQKIFVKHIDIPRLSACVRSFRKFITSLTGLDYDQLDAYFSSPKKV